MQPLVQSFVFGVVAYASAAVSGADSNGPYAAEAELLRRLSGIESGVAVVIAGNAGLACKLADDGRLLVHLLTPSLAVEQSRRDVLRRRLGGRVVVRALGEERRLPYPDRFVNLFVLDPDAQNLSPPADERLRVLAVCGADCSKEDGRWRITEAPPTDAIDGWTHRWYDASGNCVSRDRVDPRTVQWVHGPALEDGTADGKIPRIADGRWVAVDSVTGELLCRDAGNGTLLWRFAAGMAPTEDFAVVAGKIYLYHDPQTDPEQCRRHRGGYGPLAEIDLYTGRLGDPSRASTWDPAHPLPQRQAGNPPEIRRRSPRKSTG